MLLNNKKLGAWHDYKIMFVDGSWYAWYHTEITNNIDELKSLANGTPAVKGGES